MTRERVWQEYHVDLTRHPPLDLPGPPPFGGCSTDRPGTGPRDRPTYQRTGRPAYRSAPLISRTVTSPKCRTLAARTASAPAVTAGAKWSSAPAPPLAMIGTVTAALAAVIISRS